MSICVSGSKNKMGSCNLSFLRTGCFAYKATQAQAIASHTTLAVREAKQTNKKSEVNTDGFIPANVSPLSGEKDNFFF